MSATTRTSGTPIYVASQVGDEVWLSPNMRMVYYASPEDDRVNTRRCVRFERRWHPLHEVDELESEMEVSDGRRLPVYVDWRRYDETIKKLPFVKAWERFGSRYLTFNRRGPR